VEFGEPVTENGYHTTVYLNGKKPYGSDTILITSSEGGFYCGFASAVGMGEITIEAVNERLKNHDYRFIMGINVDVIDSTFKLHAYSASADAYIKGETWERLLKEGEGGSNITVDSELSDTSENPVQNKVIKAYVDEKVSNGIRELYTGNSLTDEQKAWNLETKQLVEQNKCTTVHVLTEPIGILPAGTIIPQSLYKDSLFFYMATTGNNQAIVNIGIDSNGNGLIAKEVVLPDSELSDTSENTVKNKAVKAYVDEKTSNNSYAIVLASEGFNMNRYGKNGRSLGGVYIKPNVPTRVYATTFSPNGSTGRVKSIKLSHLDTQGATDMGFMFGSRDVWQNVEELDLSYIDTSSATVMDNFVQLPNVTKLDVTSFDTSNVVNMSGMFRYCENLTDIDVSNFDTSKVLYFDSMFNECKSLKSLDLSNFNTSSATTMSYMFWYCEDLEYLNLSSFDTSNIETLRGIYGMFFGCGSIKTLILGENFFRVAAPIEGDGLQYMNNADFSSLIQWTDESVVTSLVTNIYDRIANGLPEINLLLSSQTKAVLTDEQKAIIAAKGYVLK
jgi:surface protein